ncbi:uncharacterized protein LOC128881841 [Hylaeus volcanicus]|uniref:uncharacterized protein LOC128881841 n=1 Tax=Hylaeus volcanicus TaxID=313075 RepID=UPI0023B808B1|nr:uncharacterized protein LOC128881841 [Hylaeus volcanicus]
MSLTKLFGNLRLSIRLQSSRRYFASKTDNIIESAEEVPVFLEEEKTVPIEIRDKSRLNPIHRNILRNEKPRIEFTQWYHDTLRYKRRMLGRYGMKELDVSAGIAWPTREELDDLKEYERVAYPLSLEERWHNIREKHRLEEEAIIAREKEIDAKMAKMNEMIQEMETRVARKKAEAEQAQFQKERRIREIRQRLGLTGHITNDKIKEMMEKLEKEDKKKRKEAKKQRQLMKQIELAQVELEKPVVSKEGAPDVEEEPKK